MRDSNKRKDIRNSSDMQLKWNKRGLEESKIR
jgi:hypothetical protein